MDKYKSKKSWTKRRDLFFSSSTPSSTSSKPHSHGILAYSPRCLLSRWLRPPSSENGGEEEDGGLGCRMRIPRHAGRRKEECEVVAVSVVENLEKQREESVEVSSSSSEHKPEKFTLNQGIGVGLVFLLVRSANEFNKMVELRKQMELFLRDIKDEIQKKAAMSAYAESTSIAFSASNCSGNGYASKAMHRKIDHASLSTAEVTSFKNNDSSKMDVLEAELELELSRLHFNFQSEDSSMHHPHQQIELADESDNASETFSEAEDEQNIEQNSGVCPRELERRLHELLEAQQQERIAELESALLRSEKQLKEKEIEIVWWRDTAKFASQRAACGTPSPTLLR